MTGEEVPWPPPPRDPGPWNGGPPVAPPGFTSLPPLPGAGGVVHGTSAQSNPWANQTAIPEVNIPPDRRGPAPSPVPPAPRAVRRGPRPDRAPRWLVAVSVIIVLAMAAGVAYVLLEGGRQYPEAWDERVDPIAAWVEEERELSFEHPVEVNFLSEEEYTERSTAGGDDTSEEAVQYYEDQAAQLRALGFISGEVDLAEAGDTLADSGTLAYYDPELEQVFVRGTELTPAVRVTLAHELVHVLQDQNFDLERIDELDDGRAAVLRALAEGDATLVEDTYIADVLTDEERQAYEEESAASGDEAMEEVEEKVPPILTTLFASPYILGPELIGVLDAADGWKAIDEALEVPPTEEVLFDPLVHDTDAADPKDVPIEAPEGAEVLEEGEFGSTTWFLMLASRMDPKVALEATDGWGGDQYVVYREDDAICVTVAFEGDTEADTQQMADALTTWVAASPEGTAEASTGDGRVRFRSCDPGSEAAPGGEEVTPDLLGLPVTRSQVYAQALGAGQRTDQASCFARGVIDVFTFEQLSDPAGTYIQSDAGQRALAGLRDECFA